MPPAARAWRRTGIGVDLVAASACRADRGEGCACGPRVRRYRQDSGSSSLTPVNHHRLVAPESPVQALGDRRELASLAAHLLSGRRLTEQVDNCVHQDRRWNRPSHVLAFTAGALDKVVPAVNDKRNAQLVEPLADLGGVAIIQREVENGCG